MKVICRSGYNKTYQDSFGKVEVSFKRGKIYNTITEYDDCYLFAINLEFFVINKSYFLTLKQVKERKLLSFNKKIKNFI